MASMHYLKQFDKAQLFRFFVDGRFQRKYQGWIGYEAKEQGSVQAMLNGFAFMLDNFFMPTGLSCAYLRNLHRICMFNVATANPKSSAGDIRYLNTSLPFFSKTTTYENIIEILESRHDDGTEVFIETAFRKTANQLDAKEIFNALQNTEKLSYKAWYPVLNKDLKQALESKGTLLEFYDAKHFVQISIIRKMEKIVENFNMEINSSESDDQKLAAIALLIRDLELLHPFPDGNCRVFACILLTQLLLLHDFPPAILTNPNLDAEVSLAQWIDEIKIGMEKTLILIENPTAEVFNFSISELSTEQNKHFLTKASAFINKIDAYEELFLTPKRLVNYTSGEWSNCEMTLRFSSIGGYETYSKGCIYFALALQDWVNEKKNIREELQKRIEAGARAIVLDDKRYVKNLNFPICFVKNTLQAFENCAAKVRQDIQPKTVLITGTEGKTGSKIQLYHLLRQQSQGHAVLNTSNTNIPVLRSLSSLKESDQFEITEVSAASIKKANAVNPDICFFTNIGKEHLHMHKTIDGVIQAKASVIEGLRPGGSCIVNSNLEVFAEFIAALQKRRSDFRLLTYGDKPEDSAWLISANFDMQRLGWVVNANISGVLVNYFLPLIQQHAPLMSVGILLVVKELGFDVKLAAQNYIGLQPFESMGLLHKIKTQHDDIIFYDQSRRASISGVRSAFKDLQNLTVKGQIVALVGSISSFEDNEWTKNYHEELATLINNSPISRLYTTGPNMNYVHQNLASQAILVTHSENLNSLYEYLIADLKPGDLLFIMGYRHLNLDKISARIIHSKPTDFSQEQDNLSFTNETALQYKILLASDALNKGFSPHIISNRYNLELHSVEQLKESGITYLNLRTELLLAFFKNLDILFKNEFNTQNVNNKIYNRDYENLVINEKFCNQWFNNFDKQPNLQQKSIFGNFYFFGDNSYLLTIIVGTTNLHIGFAKYQIETNKYILVTLDQKDATEINQRFSKKIPNNFKLIQRLWGYKWLTVDLGNFIDFTNAHIFFWVTNFEKSECFTKIVNPLLSSFRSNHN